MMEYKNNKALDGIRVLDLSQYLSGPFCTTILADLGADVIRIERPDRPLGSGPYINGERIYELCTNRGKRGVTINLKDMRDKEIFLKLAENSDIIVENFKPGTMNRNGVGYEECKNRNPGIIFASISGFGHTGPYSSRGAMDVIIQAMSGMMSLTGEPDGRPTKAGPSISDTLAGFFATTSILAALYYRKETGKGQFIDIAMLDSSFACLENAVANYFGTGKVPTRVGNRHQTGVPFQDFSTADGAIFITAPRPKMFEAMCNALNLEHLLADERFNTPNARRLNVDALETEITKVTSTMSTAEVEARLLEHDVAAGRINTIDLIANDPQITARSMVMELNHSKAGSYKVPASPIKMSETTPDNHLPCPALGEHSVEVFRDVLGMSPDEIQEVIDRQAPIFTQ